VHISEEEYYSFSWLESLRASRRWTRYCSGHRIVVVKGRSLSGC